jgi:RES domain.
MNEPFICCSDCFRTFALKKISSSLGIYTPTPCPVCKSKNGIKLLSEQAKQVFETYFIYGSRPSLILPPVYDHASNCSNPLTITFSNSSEQKDYIFLSSILRCTLDYTSPSYQKIHYTYIHDTFSDVIKNEIQSGNIDIVNKKDYYVYRFIILPQSIIDFFDNYLFNCFIETKLSQNIALYRARRFSPTEKQNFLNWDIFFDSAPKERAKLNRFNRSGTETWYGSFDPETCIYEARPNDTDIIESRIIIGEFYQKKLLKLIEPVFSFNEEICGSCTECHESDEICVFAKSLFLPDPSIL